MIDRVEMVNLFKSLEELGWVEIVGDDLSEVVTDRRRFRYHSDKGAMTLEVKDMINNVGVCIEYESEAARHELFRSDWISVNRLIAALDLLGIRRADDGWVTWYRAQLWG
jgi:hypothetical protein